MAHMAHIHPAKFSDILLPILKAALVDYDLVLDPFAGTGKIKQIKPDAITLEIEPEWAVIGKSIIGNALQLPFRDSTFDAICTSPCYGNRMADSFIDHQPDKNYRRNTYTHSIGRKLHSDNSGQMQWGEKYRQFHVNAWQECARVLRYGGRFVLNISDHIRNKQRVNVSQWHIDTLKSLNFIHLDTIEVETPRNRQGQNHQLRVNCEYIAIMENINESRLFGAREGYWPSA